MAGINNIGLQAGVWRIREGARAAHGSSGSPPRRQPGNRNLGIGDEAIREEANRRAHSCGAAAARRGKAAPAGRTRGFASALPSASTAACGPRYGKAPDHLDRNRPDARGIILQDAAAGNPSGQNSLELRH